MPYRSRPINWNYLLQPSMRGIDYKARAGENLAQMILGAGQSIGAGFARKKQRAERRREFDLQYGLSERRQGLAEQEFALQQERLAEDARERQAYETYVLDQLGVLSEEIPAEASMTGQVDPAKADRLRKMTDMVGGPQAAATKIVSRSPT